MKIAIHHREDSFSEHWIKYCKENSIDFKIVNCYDSNIIEQIKDCAVLMWHHSHAFYKDMLFAKTLLFSLEQAGVKVFPNSNTGWHFDDKIAQKYLLEAIDAPLVPSFIFYDKKSAELWAKTTTYPKVFKLRGGAGGEHVSLVKNKQEAYLKIKIAFGKGFSQFDRLGNFKERWRKFKNGNDTFFSLFKALGRLIITTDFAKMHGKEKGYVYFQEFIPKNDYDIRLIVIGSKYAYGMKRMNRENDFRASGSSKFVFDEIPLSVIKTAFITSKKLNLQSIAFDFIFNEDNEPLIIEMSYGFGAKGSSQCKGYWTSNLEWHEKSFNPQGWMIEELLKSISI